jgi:hypothetical protein
MLFEVEWLTCHKEIKIGHPNHDDKSEQNTVPTCGDQGLLFREVEIFCWVLENY